jgi:hypothetical protein
MQSLNTVYDLMHMENPNSAEGTGASWHYSVSHGDNLFSVDIAHHPDDNTYRTRILWDLTDSRSEVLSEEDVSYDSFYFALTESIAWIWNWCMEIPGREDDMAGADPLYVYPTQLTISVVADKHQR